MVTHNLSEVSLENNRHSQLAQTQECTDSVHSSISSRLLSLKVPRSLQKKDVERADLHSALVELHFANNPRHLNDEDFDAYIERVERCLMTRSSTQEVVKHT